MNIRVKYGKNNQGKFLSHLDLMRTWERSFRRGLIPIAFSQGFNPHPKMSFGSALAVGVTSSGEYMDVQLKNIMNIEDIKERLQNYLPPSLEIYSIIEIDPKSPSLMSIINRAKYRVEAKLKEEITEEQSTKIAQELLDQKTILVTSFSKKGTKEKDIRPGIVELNCMLSSNKENIIAEFTVQAGSQGNIRPDEVLKGLKGLGMPIDLELVNIHREGLYIAKEGQLISPLVV